MNSLQEFRFTGKPRTNFLMKFLRSSPLSRKSRSGVRLGGRGHFAVCIHHPVKPEMGGREDEASKFLLPLAGRTNVRFYCNFAYSALVSFRMGMSESASFQREKKS